jgi:ribosomal protein L37E
MAQAGTDREEPNLPAACPRCGHGPDRLQAEARSGEAMKGTVGGSTLGHRPERYYWVTCRDCGHQFWWPPGAVT